jgi:hypothetical protein
MIERAATQEYLIAVTGLSRDSPLLIEKGSSQLVDLSSGQPLSPLHAYII